jgi:hypothetical protein
MADDASEFGRLSREVNATVINMQRVMSDLQGTLREIVHLQNDLTELRKILTALNQLIREGNGSTLPIITRVLLVEQRLALLEAHETFNIPTLQKIGPIEQRLLLLETSQKSGREWWFRFLGNLAVGLVFAVAGAFLALWVGSRGGPLK